MHFCILLPGDRAPSRRPRGIYWIRVRLFTTNPAGRPSMTCVRTARIGDPGLQPSAETLEALVARHGNRVYQLAYRLTRSTADAEDVLQDVFIKLYRSWPHV